MLSPLMTVASYAVLLVRGVGNNHTLSMGGPYRRLLLVGSWWWREGQQWTAVSLVEMKPVHMENLVCSVKKKQLFFLHSYWAAFDFHCCKKTPELCISYVIICLWYELRVLCSVSVCVFFCKVLRRDYIDASLIEWLSLARNRLLLSWRVVSYDTVKFI